TSWWSSWVQKSTDTFESIKKDLNEFKETVQTDGLEVVSNTASYVSQTMKDTISGISHSVAPDYDNNGGQQTSNDTPTDVPKGVNESKDDISGDKPTEEGEDEEKSSDWDEWTANLTNRAKHKLNGLMGTIADAFLINRNYYEDEDQMYVLSGDKLVAIDKWQELLSEVQTDANTYCREPTGAPEHYESWLMTFNLIDYQRQMDHLLQTVPQMKEFYTQLVPNSLSDVEFWHRFYYRVHQLRESERKKIEDKGNELKESSHEEVVRKDNSKESVEIRLLEENSSVFESQQMKDELLSMSSNECSDMKSTADSSDTQKSETGSDDWEKTDIPVSDEESKDWVKYE
ncbi:unnamed protein product, partial [Oppiella nova]